MIIMTKCNDNGIIIISIIVKMVLITIKIIVTYITLGKL